MRGKIVIRSPCFCAYVTMYLYISRHVQLGTCLTYWHLMLKYSYTFTLNSKLNCYIVDIIENHTGKHASKEKVDGNYTI